MESISNRNAKARIEARVRSTQAQTARLKSRRHVGAFYRKESGIGRFFKVIFRWLRSLFYPRWHLPKVYAPYTGPARPKQPHPHTYGAYRRWYKNRNRKAA